jgi:3-hydroxyethyl bacteriochlorophyllide a dehydrogenase
MSGAPAFMREARIRVAAEWKPADMEAVLLRVMGGALSLSGLITHERPAADAADACRAAFGDPACLEIILDWKGAA